jgi:hypothetical protein
MGICSSTRIPPKFSVLLLIYLEVEATFSVTYFPLGPRIFSAIAEVFLVPFPLVPTLSADEATHKLPRENSQVFLKIFPTLTFIL